VLGGFHERFAIAGCAAYRFVDRLSTGLDELDTFLQCGRGRPHWRKVSTILPLRSYLATA